MSLDPVQVLLEKDAIQNIKYEYFRRLDSKQFDDLIKLFTEDATTTYDNGRHSCHGREEILIFWMNQCQSMNSFRSIRRTIQRLPLLMRLMRRVCGILKIPVIFYMIKSKLPVLEFIGMSTSKLIKGG